MDLIDRTDVLETFAELYDVFEDNKGIRKELHKVYDKLRTLPAAQPTEASCWGCNCPKMERLKEQKTFSEMVHLHDAETHDYRAETHACDCISREDVEQTVEDNILCYTHSDRPIDQDPDTECHKAIRIALGMLRKDLRKLPSAQPERLKGQWTDDNACPFCGFQPWYERDIHSLSFCPNCGADMRGEK